VGSVSGESEEGSGASQWGLSGQGGLPRVDKVKQTVVYSRYYHLFNEGELEGLVGEVKGAAVVDAYFDKSNWCVIMERTAV
jgi:alkylated DNA repair protein alkB family protein 8